MGVVEIMNVTNQLDIHD